MNIGDVAERIGLSAKTIRYYEGIDLVRPARGANGRRRFTVEDLAGAPTQREAMA